MSKNLKNWVCYSFPEWDAQTGQWAVRQTLGLGPDARLLDTFTFESESVATQFALDNTLGK